MAEMFYSRQQKCSHGGSCELYIVIFKVKSVVIPGIYYHIQDTYGDILNLSFREKYQHHEHIKKIHIYGCAKEIAGAIDGLHAAVFFE